MKIARQVVLIDGWWIIFEGEVDGRARTGSEIFSLAGGKIPRLFPI
jgi:hypothetical protein